jgi:hypothetical protein
MTPRRLIGVRQGGGVVLTGSLACFLSVTWESYITPSRMAMHFFIAIQISVNNFSLSLYVVMEAGILTQPALNAYQLTFCRNTAGVDTSQLIISSYHFPKLSNQPESV